MNFIIKRKVLIAMLFTGLTMLGYISYKQLQVELYPNATLPMLFVQVGSGLDVSPKYMENQAIIPLEGEVGKLNGVEKIESIAGERSGMIKISYKKNIDLKIAYLKLVEKTNEAQKSIPAEFHVQALKFDTEQMFSSFMTIQVRGTGGIDRVRKITDREIIDRLKNIDGIAKANVFGGQGKSVEIILHQDICNSYGVTPADVRSTLSNNSKAKTFAGKVDQNSRLHFVNVISEFNDINDIRNLIVKKQGNIRLKDIAQIHYGVKKPTSYSRVNGKESITINLTKDSQANVIELSHAVANEIKKLNKKLAGKDIEMVVQENTAETMEKNIDSIIQLALVGGLLAIFILWIFLKNFRLVIAIALAIPISVYTAFNFFYAFDITINSLTLLGMALAIGMLLDNSIVVLENIYRLASKKIHPDKAVVQGTKEVWRSIFAATLTTIMVFLPFVFSSNFFIKLFGKHIGVSIISTLLVSLVVALLLIPMITHTFLKYRNKDKPILFEKISYHNRLVQIYMVFLKTCMRKPGKTLLGAIIVFFITLLISLGTSMISSKEAEVKDIILYATMPAGSTLDNTDALIRKAEKFLAELDEKKDIMSQVNEEDAVLRITLKDDYRKINNHSIPRIKKDIMNRIDDISTIKFSWEPPPSKSRFKEGNDDGGFGEMLGIGSKSESVVIKGLDFDKMLNQANEVKYYLQQLSSVKGVNIKVPKKRPELKLDFDKHLMALYDIPLNSVMNELNSFKSEFSSGVKFKDKTEEYDIQIKTVGHKEQKEKNASQLKTMLVRGNNNTQFQLQAISKFNFTEGLSRINRVNQEKQLEVVYTFIDEVQNEKDLLEAARVNIDELIQEMNLPSGIVMHIVHEKNDYSEFGFLFLIAFILIYMILASVFESFTTPFVMMFSIPLAAIGSLVLLILSGTSLLNMNVLTGLLILLGIVVNNGIILIDYSRVLRRRGYSESRALMMAGLARVRPILITAITTIIALIPLALGKAEYVALIGVPFALTIIGGLTVSTLLTLVLIPTFNSGLQASLLWMQKQKTYIKVIQISIWILGTYFIYAEVDSRIWQIINFIVLITSVPVVIYFIQNSLRKANEKLIDENEALHIKIRNLVKIYDWDSRFMREWKSGINIRRRLGIQHEYESIKDFGQFIWQLPLVGFSIYFIYFHLEKSFWYFILPIFLYILMVYILYPVKKYALNLRQQNKKRFIRFSLLFVFKTVFWFFPIAAIYLFNKKYDAVGFSIFTLVVWYLFILIKVTSDILYRKNVNVSRIKGRFKGIRKAFYRFVLAIPVIGKKKTSFKALKGVSMDIENGMFGLLGPNGAGKSTLMKIICGILEQSYGQITINGIDVHEKREELQGLIGYLPQEFGMYENMTAWDFLHYMAILKKVYNKAERNKRIEYVLKSVHMYDNRNEKIGSFSGGMKQRVGIAQILLNLPRILVVDEPTAGLDPRERIRFRNLLVELSKERIVIFSTHIIEDIASSCNKVAVVKKGEIKYMGKPIDMAKIAKDKVWMLNIPAKEFETDKDNYVIIHHMKEGDDIRCRCLADKAPSGKAKPAKANLEDAYLYLLTKQESEL